MCINFIYLYISENVFFNIAKERSYEASKGVQLEHNYELKSPTFVK